jgi:hypothetical protein
LGGAGGGVGFAADAAGANVTRRARMVNTTGSRKRAALVTGHLHD